MNRLLESTSRSAGAVALRLLGLAVITLLALAGSPPALAVIGGESFNATNQLATNVIIIASPTNAAGFQTGGAINVANYNTVGLSFYAESGNFIAGTANTADSTLSSNVVSLTLLRSTSPNPPKAADWEIIPKWTWVVPNNNITNQGVPCILAFTNLDQTYLGSAQWIGLGIITNKCPTSIFTNVVVSVNKKVIPIRYP